MTANILIAASAEQAAIVPAQGSNRRGWEYFDERLTALRVNDVENIIARGRLLTEAKDELEHGSFEAMVKRHFDLSTARMYRIVAAHPVISNRCHVNALPPSMRTLYELTKLSTAILQEKLKDGSINPKLERKDVIKWHKGERGEVTVDGAAVERKPSPAEQLKAAKAEIQQLQNMAGGEHLFDPGKSTDREIAEAMIGRLEGWRGRAKRVAQMMLDIIDDVANRPKPKKSTKH